MTEALHIVRKDLRHLRWLLVVWIAMLGARVGFWGLGLSPRSDQEFAFMLTNSTAVIGSLQLLMLAFVAARLIHAEPPVGWNAFWLTRPYSRRALIAAKLLLAAVVFVTLPLVADLVTMAMYHAGPRAQLAAAASFVPGYVTWMLLALAVAALTPSLSTLVLTFVVGFTGLSVLMMALNVVTAYLRAPAAAAVFREFDPVPGIVATVAANVAMLGAIIYQYRRRRRRIAATLVVAGIVASMALPSFWSVERPEAGDAGEWSRNPAASPAVVEPRWQVQREYRRGLPQRAVYAPVRLQGMPREYTFYNVDGDSTFTLADGTVVKRSQRGAVPAPPGDAQSGFHSALRVGLQDATLVRGMNEGDAVYWPKLIEFSADEYSRLRGKSGRLEVTLRFHVNRTGRRAILPLEAGAADDDGLSRVEIVRTDRITEGVVVMVRSWSARSPLTSRDWGASHNFLLYNAMTREALSPSRRTQLPTPQSGTGVSVSGGSALMRLFGALTLGLHRDGFSVSVENLLYPDRIARPGEARTFGSEWFNRAQLAVLETKPAGVVTRSVTIDDFVVPSEEPK